MKNILLRMLTILAVASSTIIFTAQAQTATKPEPAAATTYSVKPDYRKCAFPLCGGWYLTPLNQFSLQLETEDEAYQNSLLVPNSIYVANIDLKKLRLSEKQTEELQLAMHNQQALLRGVVNKGLSILTTNVKSPSFSTEAAWIGANKNDAAGPYLKVASSGIVCITTPCPYFKADLVNTNYSFQFHELSLEKAALDSDQEAQAWQAIASRGLLITGLKYESQGQIGTGVGIAATKVFFAFPPKK